MPLEHVLHNINNNIVLTREISRTGRGSCAVAGQYAEESLYAVYILKYSIKNVYQYVIFYIIVNSTVVGKPFVRYIITVIHE